MRLFCFPYAGGAAHVFRDWAKFLPVTVEVCAVQFPGKGTRLKDKPYTDAKALTEAAVSALLAEFDRSFVFFGHSMGALICFEMARYLRQIQSTQPLHLFVSGCGAPQTQGRRELTYNLPEPEFRKKLDQLSGTPQEVLEHPDLMELLLPSLRADFAVVETYKYLHQPPLECSIEAFGGWQDATVKRETVEAWREQTTASFSYHMLPGNHFFLHTAQEILLEMIAKRMHKVLN